MEVHWSKRTRLFTNHQSLIKGPYQHSCFIAPHNLRHPKHRSKLSKMASWCFIFVFLEAAKQAIAAVVKANVPAVVAVVKAVTPAITAAVPVTSMVPCL